MGRTYAIGDLHGRYDVLEICLTQIEKHRLSVGDTSGEDTTIVFLGDYIDRGMNSKMVIERLMEGSRDAAKWVILMGNHEQMALMAHVDKERYWRWWCENGGMATVMNYSSNHVDEDHLRWMANLPDRYQDEHRLFVHAGIKQNVPLEEQTNEMVLWVRYPQCVETHVVGADLYVVHGHTPSMNGAIVLSTRCNLDVHSYATGVATIGVFEDDVPGPPVELIEASAWKQQ
jgi:serine/threonine protein phosphatase 1